MKTRIVHTKFWRDALVTSLRRDARYLFLYLLTCEAINICGIFELPDSIITADTGLSGNELSTAKKELSDSKKVVFYNGWIKVVNVNRYNSFNGPKNDIAKMREISLVPKCLNTSIDTSIHTTLNTNHNHNTNTNHKGYDKAKLIRDKLLSIK